MRQCLAMVLALLFSAAAAWAVRGDLREYSIILQRQPFGSPPAVPVKPPEPEKPKTPGPDSFIKTLRMCAITENDAGIRVGLIDIRSKPTKSYFLYLGDEEDGIRLVDADYVEESALLRKGDEEFWIDMSNTHTGKSPGPQPTAAAATRKDAKRRPSYAERLRQRRQREADRMQEMANRRPKLTTEELDAKLKEYQMDVIREGQPPLPIPLTPEMDDQLVAEGVLPPL